MLQSLHIKHLAIIDDIGLEFSQGLNIITGETGSGKSIIMGALGLLAGERASRDVVRRGEAAAEVSALFRVPLDDALTAILEHRGIEASEELLLKRRISKEGRSQAWINGAPATVGMLVELASLLVAISGQHEQFRLLTQTNYVDIIDSFGGHEELLVAMAAAHSDLSSLQRRLDALTERERERAQREDFLAFQLGEIDEAALEAGEDERIEGELKVLEHLERLQELVAAVLDTLEDGPRSASGLLQAASSDLERAAAIDERLGSLGERLRSATIEVEDVAFELGRRVDDLEQDPEALDALRQRMEVIRRLTYKYADTVDGVLAQREEMAKELAALETIAAEIEEHTRARDDAARRARELATRLSERRGAVVGELGDHITGEVRQLGMEHATVRVTVSPTEELGAIGPRGWDRVEILIETNPSEGYAPLSKVASGGELSRLLLAIKTVLHDKDPVGLYILDEIDTGIGGRIGTVVGSKLRAASRVGQFIIITHLPQIAAFGDTHLNVTKTIQEGRSVTRVTHLADDQREREIARMLGGEVTDTSLEHARELLAAAGG